MPKIFPPALALNLSHGVLSASALSGLNTETTSNQMYYVIAIGIIYGDP